MGGLYVGLISGTSVDAIDSALVRFDPELAVIATLATPWPPALRARVLATQRNHAALTLDDYGSLDVEVGAAFAAAAEALLDASRVTRSEVTAIGSHGQTLWHRPFGPHPFSIQIGDPTRIVERTGITTVADFRRRDIAAGGQGAPLLPALHAALFRDTAMASAVLNLGGIGNVTLLPADHRPVLGFDTGPANCLLDAACERAFGSGRDDGGARAARGNVDCIALKALLDDPYFAAPPPKSSGREYFNLAWLERLLDGRALDIDDLLATLTELTAVTVAESIKSLHPRVGRVICCGGGVHNHALMARLADHLAPMPVVTTIALGVDPDFVEAIGFAWLARATLAGNPGNIASVTGARGPRILGAIHRA